MTWLKYAVNQDNTLIAIADVSSGKTKLFCPYCAGQLIAKKGKLKQHHFAHAEETCYPVATKKELPTLPLYDNFNIKLSGTALQLLKKLWQSFGVYEWGIPHLPELKPLIKAKVLQKNFYLQPPAYEFTSLGKIPIGALPLHEFNTEYYLFNDTSIADTVLDDLNQMEPKVFSSEEEGVVAEASLYRNKEIDLQLVMVN